MRKVIQNVTVFVYTSLCPILLYSDSPPYYEAKGVQPFQYENLPWLTGTLLTPAENILPARTVNIEPYVLGVAQYGRYDQKGKMSSLPDPLYSFVSTTYLEYGVANYFDVQIAPQFYWNHTKGASEWVMGDWEFIADFQLLYMDKQRWWPNIKLALSGTIPFGKYQNLDPQKRGTDKGGTGSINPSVGVVFGRVFQWGELNYFRPRLFFQYTIPNSVSVKGLNAYGGGKGTKGVVYPGPLFLSILGAEYTLSRNWALSCDIQYAHQLKQHFKGKTVFPLKAPSSESWSLAPAFEYNWNASLGLITGVWFSFSGRNAFAFANGVAAFNAVF